ncbi:DNA-binding response regulator [Paenibacillus baekrokdamisoli]|uniref:DNA-binding response regulator n=1 Tax=Paenibacillus baekrokdamisoli TaxID=1712516 RepID=A0A3G9IUP9_9BACL|nr:response regulator [Paenibacillus baekrokdamisoli]MBB3070915.1 YesN/AraC family two-component response regulator [Paenibacillus baekrokdamisoli]BBH22146.1 DNA-binding response regulator [Paenibacillus baekrokdamisoli]
MKIMLVDDEPIFLEQLKELITRIASEERSTSFEIIAECYSGQMALDRIPLSIPDVIVTDIKMSSMDGIELAHKVQQRWPSTAVIIISGFSTFDYARDALRANVEEYLLKPIEADAVRSVLLRIQERLSNKTYSKGKEILQLLIETNRISSLPELIQERLFPYAHYRLLIIPDHDFSIDNDMLLPQSLKVEETYYSKSKSYLDEQEELWVLRTNSRKELVVVFAFQTDPAVKLNNLLQLSQNHFMNKGRCPSIAYSDSVNHLTDINMVYRKLTDELYKNLVIGQPKFISLSNRIESHHDISLLKADEMEQLSLYLNKSDWKQIKKLINHLFRNWGNKHTPLLYLEKNLKSIVRLLEQQLPPIDIVTSKTLEIRIEELCFVSSSFSETAESFWDLIIHVFQPQVNESDSGALLFHQIENYVSAHLKEALTLGDLIERFHISSSYLCNLFRNNSGKSFVEYITALRVEKAKSLMLNYPSMLLKDIAEIVGYQDHHYFSRVFKTVVGTTPKEYKNISN